MSLTDAEKNRLKKAGLKGLNKPKRTPSHPTKKGVVAVRDKGKVKIIRFGDQKMGHNYSAEARKSFKARHAKNIKKGKTSAAYWANKVWENKLKVLLLKKERGKGKSRWQLAAHIHLTSILRMQWKKHLKEQVESLEADTITGQLEEA